MVTESFEQLVGQHTAYTARPYTTDKWEFEVWNYTRRLQQSCALALQQESLGRAVRRLACVCILFVLVVLPLTALVLHLDTSSPALQRTQGGVDNLR